MPRTDFNMDGILNKNDSPRIDIKLFGQLSKPQLFNVVIDTGFTGSISMPFVRALSLGLVLFSTASFTLADGSKETALLCLGRAMVGEIEKPVIISLTKGSDVLIGTEFLALFGIKLELDYQNKKFNLDVLSTAAKK